jgi:hypothetical protein
MQRLYVFISVVLLLLFSRTGFAAGKFNETYQWPLKLPKHFSSAFADSRPGRFHKGIDLRTGGIEGARVYAPEDGYIWRIKTAYRGYGKALYLRGNSGRIYVFYHLKTYAWDIGTLLRNKQIETKRYYQDIDPGAGRLPVKRGDFIARSGQTGVGAPHLHFEVRDANDRPTNPLYYNIKYTDNTPPHLDAVWLAYLDDGSLSETGGREIFLKPIYNRKAGQFVLTDTVAVTGRFAVKAAISDYVAPGSFTLGPSRIKLYIDDVLYHEVDYDRLDFSEDRYSVLDRDFDPAKEDYSRVYNLYRKKGNLLSIYRSDIGGDGSFADTIGGFHTVRIEAADPHGNTSRMEFVVYYFPVPEILAPFNRAEISDSLITLLFSEDHSANSFDSVALMLSGDGPGRDTLPVVLYPKIERDDRMIRLRGDFTTGLNYQIRFIKDGVVYPPYYLSPSPAEPNGDDAVDSVGMRIVDDGLLITAAARDYGVNWLMAEIVTDRGSENVFFRKTGGKRFSLLYRPGGDIETIQSIIMRGPVGFRPDTMSANVYCIPSGKAVEVDVGPGRRLAFGAGDLFSDALLVLRDTIMPAPATGYYVDGPYIVDPQGYSFADWVDLETTISDTSVDPAKIGLYVYNDEDSVWDWAGGVYDSTTHILVSPLGGAGLVAVIADTSAPVLADLNIDEYENVKISHPTVRFKLTDGLSGIEDDLNFDVTIDGKWMVPEYDPERDLFTSKTYWMLTGGRHELQINIHDRCGNVVSASRTFVVGAKIEP